MPTIRAKLTKRTVDATAAPAEGETWVWDTELKGFFLRVRPSGRKVYAVRYRLGSRQNVFTIGTHGSPWTPDEARDVARQALGRVRDREDPGAEKRAARDALTVAQLIEAYVTDGPATKPAKRASSWREDGSNLRRHIKPQLGSKLADAVTKADAARSVQGVVDGATAVDEKTGKRGRARVTGGEAAARRTRTTAAAMYAWAVEHGLAKTNPFAALKLAAAPVRERFLSRDEAGRFLSALAELETEGEVSATFGDALRVLLLTGARKTEVLGLTWAEVDTERRILVLPPARTKAGGKTGERRIVLSPPALAILNRRAEAAEAGAVYVFPAARGDGHAVGLRRAFVAVTARAKLAAVRIHDLRHSFASFAVADGASLFLVGKLLGHANSRTTERYAHLSGDPLAEAAALVGRRIMPVAEGDGGGQVVVLETARKVG